MNQNQCEDCKTFTGSIISWAGWNLCNSCYDKRIDAREKYYNNSVSLKLQRKMSELYQDQIQKENSQLKIATDIFNAKIQSIHELKTAIDADESVENKNYKLAEVLAERFKHLSDLLFAKNKEIIEAENEQRAIQTYYHELVKKLRKEEYEKIRLEDKEYKPSKEFVPKVAKAKPKLNWDKTGVKVAADKSGLPEQAIMMVCMTRNLHPNTAVEVLIEAGVKPVKT